MRYLFFILLLLAGRAFAQSIPSDHVVGNDELATLLNDAVRKQLISDGQLSEADLASYFRQKFSERFFYDYRTFDARLVHYNEVFQNQENHRARALDHMGKFADSTRWVLPFNYLTGEPVDAYALRHLARQHKMVDVAMRYFNEGQDPAYIRYFENQLRSLNAALASGRYETIADGNGVYEAFRSGYRILNWLWIHTMFLNEPEYTNGDQLTTIATLLQHGQHLYETNDEFVPGNHQTRGMSALAMLAILLRDFNGTDAWFERAMLRLDEHLGREINADGFQFERSVHYHMSDINNYYYVYQLARINNIAIDSTWEEKLRGLFTTLVRIAYPDRSAPVLQDDTEIPWAEKNDISGAMTLGYLLFDDPAFGYFASNKVDERVYWFLSSDQLVKLEEIHQQQPAYGSVKFEETGYYIMREGWAPDDKMMIISAGLDDKKPDHQHGDMLGIQAFANGHVLLPNYQVRYSLGDYAFFKNSMVKNVALVDDQLQGKNYTSNKGGSGFGKFLELPNPHVIAWEVNDNFDFFAGSHDGFENAGVAYMRQVIFVKNEFWIIKDSFKSASAHQYKQVWQGDYTDENGPDLLRANAPDASGHDIIQLRPVDSIHSSGTRGKRWSVVTKSDENNFSFLTVIYPYRGYSRRFDETSADLRLNDWRVIQSEDSKSTIIESDRGVFLFDTDRWNAGDLLLQSSQEMDVFVRIENDTAFIHSLSVNVQTLQLLRHGETLERTLAPGDVWRVTLDSGN